MMHELIYTSTSTGFLNEPDNMKTLLEVARNHNYEYGITGILLFDGTYFMQLIEGETKFINDLYERLLQDNRHEKVCLESYSPVKKRLFSEWDMEYRQMDGSTIRGPDIHNVISINESSVDKQIGKLQARLNLLEKYQQIRGNQ